MYHAVLETVFGYHSDSEQQPSRAPEDYQLYFDDDPNSEHEGQEGVTPAHLPVTISASIQLKLAKIRLMKSKYKHRKTTKLEKLKGKGKICKIQMSENEMQMRAQKGN